MKFRIIDIKGCETCKQVLLYISREADSEDIPFNQVNILAWHKHEGVDYIQQGSIVVNADYAEDYILERIIADFSELSANEFANAMTF